MFCMKLKSFTMKTAWMSKKFNIIILKTSKKKKQISHILIHLLKCLLALLHLTGMKWNDFDTQFMLEKYDPYFAFSLTHNLARLAAHTHTLSLSISVLFGLLFLQKRVDIWRYKWKIDQHYRHLYHISNYKMRLLFLPFVFSPHAHKPKWILNVFRCNVKEKWQQKMMTEKDTLTKKINAPIT